MHSCLYEGTVTHRRREPVTHQFQYRLFMVYLDLDELPRLVGRRQPIASSKYAGRSFMRRDHLFDHSQPLAAEVRRLVCQQTGKVPKGSIRLLTQLRYFGCYFSPLNLFYVYDQQNEHVECVLAEVSNTPWNERHAYVLCDANRVDARDALQFAHPKQFHVSPFMGMEMEYHWRLTEPGSKLTAHIANLKNSRKIFDASMSLHRRELTRQQLRLMTFRYPLVTARIGAAIYYQALKLWWKKCPFYTHPNKLNDAVPQASAPKPLRKEKMVVR